VVFDWFLSILTTLFKVQWSEEMGRKILYIESR